MRTQVAVVGAGPAGLMLSHLLHQAGIDSVVVEARPRAATGAGACPATIESHAVTLLDQTGAAAGLWAGGAPQDGIGVRFEGLDRRIDFQDTIRRGAMAYDRAALVRDLVALREGAHGVLLFGCEQVRAEGCQSGSPRLHLRHQGQDLTIACDVVAGCDGFHGTCRTGLPPGAWRGFEHAYGIAWLSVLAEAPPGTPEPILACHPGGFAMRSVQCGGVGAWVLQCPPHDDPAAWSGDRIWSEMQRRMGEPGVAPGGTIIDRRVIPLRSFVMEPMQCGRLFLAGDAAHLVPPLGAKGIAAALADVQLLARALERWYGAHDDAGLQDYSQIALRRVWLVQRFTAWLTGLLHRPGGATPYDRRLHWAELDVHTRTGSGKHILAENYVGLPLTL